VWKTGLFFFKQKMLWPASQMASPLLMTSDFCHPQEFSNEDAEEDIDELMSAHSGKTERRRFSNTLSNVRPTNDPVQTQQHQKRIIGSDVHIQYKRVLVHSPSPDE